MEPRHTDERKARGTDAGTTLVELTLGLACAVVIVSAVLTATVRHSTHRKANQERDLATLAAIDTLERMRSVPFGTLASMDGTGFDVLDPSGNPGGLAAVAGDPDGLPGRIEVRPELSVGIETIYRVTAIVEWTGIRAENRVDFQQLLVERK